MRIQSNGRTLLLSVFILNAVLLPFTLGAATAADAEEEGLFDCCWKTQEDDCICADQACWSGENCDDSDDCEMSGGECGPINP